ncbi:MAG: hypothetical protein OEZ35_01840 [Candidatus Bathyarchaeota archaeon]|nr:hypothetical protein [Candidatus Bathyarchaeota archaeon]
MKVAPALTGIILAALVGWSIGAIWEHPPGPGGLQILGALIGGLLAVTVLILGEALKDRH